MLLQRGECRGRHRMRSLGAVRPVPVAHTIRSRHRRVRAGCHRRGGPTRAEPSQVRGTCTDLETVSSPNKFALLAAQVPAKRAALVGNAGMAMVLLLTVPVLTTRQWLHIFLVAALLRAAFRLAFGGSLRYLSNVVPPRTGVRRCRPTTYSLTSPTWCQSLLSVGQPPSGRCPSSSCGSPGVVSFTCLCATGTGLTIGRGEKVLRHLGD